uniref:Hyaluronidase n=1 Tax=Cyprinus carpio carpio TaxID=630221 RepID=A0A9J7Z3R0_CYPCA
MEEMLKLGRREHPGGLWGFYGFPCCYNYQYKTYTGECPALEIKRNDKLVWLWNVSLALYPDIYLDLGALGSRAAGFNLVLFVYVFFCFVLLYVLAVIPIHIHYKTDRLQRFELKISVCVLLKKQSRQLHLGCPGGGLGAHYR